jgi:hypothetical protein
MNSNFAIAFIGGFAGAIGGALGAQRIVERSRQREERLKELRFTNAAIMIAHTICNSALALKKQHVQPMRESFLKAVADFEALKTKRNAGQMAEFHLEMDMRTFPAPTIPIETLKHIAFQELSTVGRPLALISVIEQSIIGLTAAIEKRDQIIKNFKNGDIPENNYTHYYFGLPNQKGHVNHEYPDLIEVIHSYVDDLALFSYILSKDFMTHGTKVREILIKKYSKQVPHVSEADFSRAVKSGLMPPDTPYKDWLNSFVERSNT